MKALKICLILFAISLNAPAQQLLKNLGFEYHHSDHSFPTNLDQGFKLADWKSKEGQGAHSPDWY